MARKMCCKAKVLTEPMIETRIKARIEANLLTALSTDDEKV